MRLRYLVDDLRIDAERLAGFAQRTARSVRGDCRCNRRAVAAIFMVDILNDFFAPLVFEVDVDVRRLAALFRNEALEQHVALIRSHFGNAEAIANSRVSCRTTPLTQNVLALRIADDVIDR